MNLIVCWVGVGVCVCTRGHAWALYIPGLQDVPSVCRFYQKKALGILFSLTVLVSRLPILQNSYLFYDSYAQMPQEKINLNLREKQTHANLGGTQVGNDLSGMKIGRNKEMKQGQESSQGN